MYQRQYPRIVVQVPGRFQGEVPAAEGTVLNLSWAGCAFRSDRVLHVGQFLEVDIHLPGAESSVHVDVAVVRWAQDQKFGLDFLQIKPEAQRCLRGFVRTPSWVRRLKRLLGRER